MNRSPYITTWAAHLAALLLILGVSSAPLQAQPKLQITSPKDGDVVPSGKPLVVRVAASPPLAFRYVCLMVESPLENHQALTAEPYQFTIQVPPGISSRHYSLGAIGVTADEQGADFGPITIDIERPDSPQQLEAQPSSLIMSCVGVEGGVEVYGKFSDGSRVDLTHSSKTTYSSDAPAVATVDSNGSVTAVGPGSARITIENAGKSVVVPVTVPNERPPAGPRQ